MKKGRELGRVRNEVGRREMLGIKRENNGVRDLGRR